jgi:hypothetical protein
MHLCMFSCFIGVYANKLCKAKYGRGNLFSAIASRPRTVVAGAYSLNEGTKAEIQERVKWLLDDSNFAYGGISVKV